MDQMNNTYDISEISSYTLYNTSTFCFVESRSRIVYQTDYAGRITNIILVIHGYLIPY